MTLISESVMVVVQLYFRGVYAFLYSNRMYIAIQVDICFALLNVR